MKIMKIDPSIFKDYDIRGEYPKQLNKEVARKIGAELVNFLKPKVVAVGRDMRTSSDEIFAGFVAGVTNQGVDVVNLGLITSDMIYFAAGKYGFDVDVIITGSHAEGENGFKIVKKGAIAISGETGLYQIRDKLLTGKEYPATEKKGRVIQKEILKPWVEHALSFVDLKQIKPYKIVIDAGNGMAGKVMPEVEKHLPGEFVNLYFKLDGTFPHHFPNPLIEENLADIRAKTTEVKADFGIAFDADGDRAFFLDENGKTVTGTVLTAMMAKSLLKKNPGATILYNAICGRIVPETIKKHGGKRIRVRVGHTIIKQKMREHDALFAGEHSGHYYFRNNYYADSGLIGVLVALELISIDRRPLSQIVTEFEKYPASGEINFVVRDREMIVKAIRKAYANAPKIDELDGISVWYHDWWFNVRLSHTEPLLRLNVEADNEKILQEKTERLKKEIKSLGGKLKK